MFEGVTKLLPGSARGVNNELDLISEWAALGKLPPKSAFVTILPSIQDYKKIVRVLGHAKAREVLLAIHDAAAGNLYPNSRPSWLRYAMQFSDFEEKLLRSSESHFAFHNLAAVVFAREAGDVGLSSNDLVVSAKLQGFANSHEVSLSWSHESVVPKRMNVIVGRNGVGKTQLLHAIAKSLAKRAETVVDRQGERPRFSRLIYVGASAERRSLRIRVSSIPVLEVGSPGAIARRTAELLARLLRDETEIAGKPRFELALSAIIGAFGTADVGIDVSNEVIPVGELKARLQSLAKSGQLRFVRSVQEGRLVIGGRGGFLASGQLQFLWLIVNIYAFVEDGSLFLIDEPEAHLHPTLISQLIGVFDEVLRTTGSVALISTHSAYVVREIPSDCVHVVQEDAGVVRIVQPRLQTFGADVGSVSYFVFGDELIARMLADIKRAARAGIDISNYYSEVSVSARMELEDMVRNL